MTKCVHVPHDPDTLQTVCERCHQEITPHPADSDVWGLLASPQFKAFEEQLRVAESSGMSEGRLLAEFFRDLLDGGSGNAEILSSLNEIVEWVAVFRKAL